MAIWRAIVPSAFKGEKDTSNRYGLDHASDIVRLFAKISQLLVVPWIIFNIPPTAVAQQNMILASLLAVLSLAGMLLARPILVSVTYSLLVFLFIWGKTVADLYRIPGPDTALFLFQFMMILFFYELSETTLTFDANLKTIRHRQDEFSKNAQNRIRDWCNNQFLAISKTILAAMGLSLGLLLLGASFSVAVDQLAFTALLVVALVIVLLFFLTYRREPRKTM